MCGLTGFLGGAFHPGGDDGVLQNMSDTLIHRGPDDSGIWHDSEQRIGLGHRRLAVLDLSSAGHQPMASASGRFVLAFNGEIYNHLELRDALGKDLAWRGHSDTESLLAGVEAWGLEATLRTSVGMFAIALWDRETRTLMLARDRMGEKPLYYGWQGSGSQRAFLFGSELKALKAHPAFSAGVDRGALCLLLRHNYVPAPYSIFQGIAKLEPGCLLSVSMAQTEPSIRRYWDAAAVARAGRAHTFVGTADEAVDALEAQVRVAVRQQMLADVPLGAFLSGGVDSSVVVALMQAQSSRPIKTFTIGFHEKDFNEAEQAKAVASYLGTEHTELYVTHQQAMAVIPRLPDLYCEPFADSTQIPNFLLSELARQHVTVSLSGDAGDELFCGYGRYAYTRDAWRKLSAVPYSVRAVAANCITVLSPAAWNRLAGLTPGLGTYRMVGNSLHKRAKELSSRTVDELYAQTVSHVGNSSEWVLDGKEPSTYLTGRPIDLDGLDVMERMMALDAASYLPDDILVKVDRAAMGVSLETRVPLLDHRVVEFAWSLPLGYKLRDGQSKWALREVLHRHVPRQLVDRPKQGFSVPLHDWLRGSLREWAESLLDGVRLRREGYFHPEPIRKAWTAHLSGRRNWTEQLWNVLMFQAWLDVR